MITRRQFLKASAVAGAGVFLSLKDGGVIARAATPNAGLFATAAAIQGGSLPPGNIPKYVEPLVIPPAMPKTSEEGIDYYEIAVRQFQQHILPQRMGLAPTTVWSYGSVNHPGTFNYPAFTIEATYNKPVRVKWINQLVDDNGNYLPHLLSVDPTLHWANPPGGIAERDMRPTFNSTPGPYTGPVPLVTHLHGIAGVGDESDGYTEAWFLPNADNIPAGYATEGTWYNFFKAKAESKYKQTWERGTAVFQYPNSQRATTMWYHDHTLGMTRLNVYAGPAGFYIQRGGPDDVVLNKKTDKPAILPGPAPISGSDPFGTFYEIPIAIQDRSFNADGSLFYPGTRTFFDGLAGPYIPDSDFPPIWNPEFFGNTMVVNGRTWPYLNVEPRRYRFRFLNGCNSRFLILKFDNKNLRFAQIGNEGGFLPQTVVLGQLLMAPAERADVIVDFSGLAVGTKVTLLNLGPDAPFAGGGGPKADPNTTGQVMQFRVVASTVAKDPTTPPGQLRLPAIAALGAPSVTRQVSLNEMMGQAGRFMGPAAAMLGTVEAGVGVMKLWADPITENPALGVIEEWELYNFTADAHPIHIHEVHFKVVNRQPFGGAAVLPQPWETGWKDTVIAYPGQITRVRAKFDNPGLFVWHCHIVEHEDNEMMRPYAIGTIPTPE